MLNHRLYDRILLWLILGLSSIGFVMVTSSSMQISMRLFGDPFYFAKRDALYFIFSFCLSIVILQIPIAILERYSSLILCINLIMLIGVLILGHSVNGASRWITIGFLTIQPSELSKLSLFIYLSSYLKRKLKDVRTTNWGFYKPIGVMILFSLLLLAQPDLGTVVVLLITTLAILFISGAKIWQLLSIFILFLSSMIFLIIIKPYRIQRVIAFLDPWKDPFGSGYQLTQSLVAFGRGNLFGQGLGNSVQKLEYLPEAYTDFIFSILAEELGYFGVISVLIMVFIISFRAISIGRNALEINQTFSCFLSCSIGIWLVFQTIVNVGAASGMLPTKGLTFPIISYGGSSLVIMLTAIVILLRIDFEIRLTKIQAIPIYIKK